MYQTIQRPFHHLDFWLLPALLLLTFHKWLTFCAVFKLLGPGKYLTNYALELISPLEPNCWLTTPMAFAIHTGSNAATLNDGIDLLGLHTKSSRYLSDRFCEALWI